MKEKEEEKEVSIVIDGELAYEHFKQVVEDGQVTMRVDKFMSTQIQVLYL